MGDEWKGFQQAGGFAPSDCYPPIGRLGKQGPNAPYGRVASSYLWGEREERITCPKCVWGQLFPSGLQEKVFNQKRTVFGSTRGNRGLIPTQRYPLLLETNNKCWKSVLFLHNLIYISKRQRGGETSLDCRGVRCLQVHPRFRNTTKNEEKKRSCTITLLETAPEGNEKWRAKGVAKKPRKGGQTGLPAQGPKHGQKEHGSARILGGRIKNPRHSSREKGGGAEREATVARRCSRGGTDDRNGELPGS